MSETLEALRAFVARFKGEAGYVLKPGEKGARRWHAEPHDTLHTPHDNPPELYRERDLPKIGEKPNSANSGWMTRIAGMDHYVKFPYGRDHGTGEDEARNELAAYTVLGSLGFRVPHTSVVLDPQGCPGVVSRRLGEGGLGIRSLDELSVGEYDNFALAQYDPHPSDRGFPQGLAEALAVDHDRHTGNMMLDEHGRRWDIDFGTSEAHRWLFGLGLHDARHIADRLEVAAVDLRDHPRGEATFTASLRRLADPATLSAFDWLRTADQRPYRALGFDHPHQAVTESLRTLRPDVEKLLRLYG